VPTGNIAGLALNIIVSTRRPAVGIQQSASWCRDNVNTKRGLVVVTGASGSIAGYCISIPTSAGRTPLPVLNLSPCRVSRPGRACVADEYTRLSLTCEEPFRFFSFRKISTLIETVESWRDDIDRQLASAHGVVQFR
jgi:hypothetical protein